VEEEVEELGLPPPGVVDDEGEVLEGGVGVCGGEVVFGCGGREMLLGGVVRREQGERPVSQPRHWWHRPSVPEKVSGKYS